MHGDTQTQFEQIEHCVPTQRGNVSLSNLSVLNAVLTIYMRMNRWSKAGVLDRVFADRKPLAIPRRLEHQDFYGCRLRSNGNCVLAENQWRSQSASLA
jgi:hypothetical protein